MASRSKALAALAEIAASEDRAALLLAERRFKEAEATNRELLKRLGEVQEQVKIAAAIREYGQGKPIRSTKAGKFRGTALAMCSDWHVEEDVRPETVNWLNEYSPAIAEKRAHGLFRGFDWNYKLLTLGEYRYQIDTIVLWLGGDFISGYIHDELQESNHLSPTKAIRLAARLISAGIDYLLAETPARLVIPTNHGNHGRTTLKRRVSTAADNSLEHLLYHVLAERYAKEPRVEFDIADGSLLYREIEGRTVRFHHGDDVRYGGGVGGITIPIRKAIAQWNKSRHADLTVMGHYHDDHVMRDFLVNGSLIGWNAFAASIKASYSLAGQMWCVLDPDREGVRFATKIDVQDDPRRRLAA